MIPNGERWHYTAVKKSICIINKNNVKTPMKEIMEISIILIIFILLEQKRNLTKEIFLQYSDAF